MSNSMSHYVQFHVPLCPIPCPIHNARNIQKDLSIRILPNAAKLKDKLENFSA
jgi:hypothetical protein